MHSRNDLNCTRGYEFWLMKEAKLRSESSFDIHTSAFDGFVLHHIPSVSSGGPCSWEPQQI